MNFQREYYSYQPSPAPLLPARALQLPKQQSPELIKQLGLRQASAHHQFIPVKRYWASATPIYASSVAALALQWLSRVMTENLRSTQPQGFTVFTENVC